ncbi:MAG: protein kinase domain-containing protein [Planctomycetota bacterium]
MSTDRCPRCGGRLVPSPEGEPPTCPVCAPHHDSDVETKTASGQPPAPTTTDYRGKTFGTYEILEEISRGAMGVVYKARQRALRRVVALKVLIAGDLATDAQVKRFQREAQAAARLRHPAIVPIHEVGVCDGKHYYTMDYIEGRPLSELIAEGEITTRRALDIAGQVAEALSFAHDQGVIHRDIKPSNIMVDPGGGVHIMDFGLAKQLDSDTKFTKTGTTVGTPAYMPPEQASGASRRVDHRADIYSLGAVLYEMLTGRPPFTGDTMMSTLMRVLNEDPVPPKRVNARIHRDVQTIVLKAMEKNPDRRYGSVAELADDIHRFIGGEAIAARPAGMLYRGWKALRKHRSAVFAAVAIVVIGLAAHAVVQQRLQDIEERSAEEIEAIQRRVEARAKEEIEEAEKPTVKTVFEDRFDRPALGDQWVAERGPWTIGDGALAVTAGAVVSLRTRQQFTGNVSMSVEVSLPPQRDGTPQSRAVVGCFLGSAWHRSYRVSVDGRRGWRLVLMNRREEVAKVTCPPLQPDVPYLMTVTRSPIGLEVVLESETGGMRRTLAYKELDLPSRLRGEFPVGLFTEGTRLRVHRVTVRQEFPPRKTTPLRAAEGLFRDGNYGEARRRFAEIVQGYPGSYDGLAARLGIARALQAERRDAEARRILNELEEQAAGVEHEELAALLARSRLHQFFVNARLNRFADAARALSRIARSGEHIDGAWVWQFPDYLSRMVFNRVFDEALAVLGAEVFGPQRVTLHQWVGSLQAPALEAAVVSRVQALAAGLCDHGQFAKVQDVYEAYPTPELGDVLAQAVGLAVRRGERDEALGFLSFAHERGLSGPAMTRAAVEVAEAFCEAGLYVRLAKVYEACPDPALAPVFVRAVHKAIDAEKLDAGLDVLRLSAESFPDHREELLASDGPAIRLGRAFVTRGDVLGPIAIHGVFGPGAADPALLSLFEEAARKALAAEQPDDARRLLRHCRDNFGILHPGLAAVAARLIDHLASEGEFEKAKDAYRAYRNDAVAPAAARAIAAIADAGKLADALALFSQYADSRHSLPKAAVERIARALAALDPQDEATRALLEQYSGVYEAYESPAARSTMTLALGDAYLRVGRLAEALTQYAAAGDAAGHLRAACVATELGRPERALAEWQQVRELADDASPALTAAAYMLGEATREDLEAAAGDDVLPPALAHYLVDLRLWTDGDPTAAAELARVHAPPDIWFGVLARRIRAAFSPSDEP